MTEALAGQFNVDEDGSVTYPDGNQGVITVVLDQHGYPVEDMAEGAFVIVSREDGDFDIIGIDYEDAETAKSRMN